MTTKKLTTKQLRIRNNAICRANARANGARGINVTIARKYGLTRARVSQIVAAGLTT